MPSATAEKPDTKDTAKDTKAKKKEFQMPPVVVGQVVYWYQDGQRETTPCAAMVTEVTDRNVALNVFQPGFIQLAAPDGVMHIDDPAVQNQYNDNGAWDYKAPDGKP